MDSLSVDKPSLVRLIVIKVLLASIIAVSMYKVEPERVRVAPSANTAAPSLEPYRYQVGILGYVALTANGEGAYVGLSERYRGQAVLDIRVPFFALPRSSALWKWAWSGVGDRERPAARFLTRDLAGESVKQIDFTVGDFVQIETTPVWTQHTLDIDHFVNVGSWKLVLFDETGEVAFESEWRYYGLSLASIELEQLADAIAEKYGLADGIPLNGTGSGWDSPLNEELTRDPWGRPYRFLERRDGFSVYCFGADGLSGGVGDCADIEVRRP
ncbi:MAG: type II secretion system protein GspG [Planctomycetota bacterium]